MKRISSALLCLLVCLVLLSLPGVTLQDDSEPINLTKAALDLDPEFKDLFDKELKADTQILTEEEQALLDSNTSTNEQKMAILEKYQEGLKKILKELDIDFDPDEEYKKGMKDFEEDLEDKEDEDADISPNSSALLDKLDSEEDEDETEEPRKAVKTDL